MPNVIKSATTVSNGTLKRNNFLIGVDTSLSYGPTDNGVVDPAIDVTSTRTFFWNGITPPSGGYTVYVQKSSGGPSIFVASGDTELITIAIQNGGTNINTVSDALSYFNNQSNYLVTNIDYPSIVTSGLTLFLDSSYTPSYAKTGTAWNDLSSSVVNATMFGSVPYELDGVNCFNFATATGASSLNSSLGFTFTSNMIPTSGNFTLSCWIKNPNAGSGNQIGLFSNAGGANGYRFGVSTTAVYYLVAPTLQEGDISFLSTLSASLWYNVVAVYNRVGGSISVYLNGVFQNSVSIPSQTAFSNTAPGLVRSPCCNIYRGKLANFSAYNRDLSQAEITKNYDAQKSRFGL